MAPHVYLVLLISSCFYALWRGGTDERLIASVCLIASLVSVALAAPLRTRFQGVETGLLVIDLIVLAIFVGLALQSRRFWPLWVAGLQLTTSMAHVMKAVDLRLMPQVYAAAGQFWSYPILVIVAVGAWRHHRRAKRENRLTPAA